MNTRFCQKGHEEDPAMKEDSNLAQIEAELEEMLPPIPRAQSSPLGRVGMLEKEGNHLPQGSIPDRLKALSSAVRPASKVLLLYTNYVMLKINI